MERAVEAVVSMPMVQLAERTLHRRPAWDLPSRNADAVPLLAPGPEDRIGPLASGGSLRPVRRLHTPTILVACALVAGIGTAALVRPWRSPSPQAVVVRPIQPPTAPSVAPPAAVPVVPPPPAVVALTAPPERADAVAPAKALERIAPAARPAPLPEVQHESPTKAVTEDDADRRDDGAPKDREARPVPNNRKHEARSIRRVRPAVSAKEVEQTGSNAAGPRAAKPDPSANGSTKGWNLPSVLRPGGM